MIIFAIWEIWTGWKIYRLRSGALKSGRIIQGIKIVLSLLFIAMLFYASIGAWDGSDNNYLEWLENRFGHWGSRDSH